MALSAELAGQADYILFSLHPPSDLFSPVPQFGNEKYKSEEIKEVPQLYSQFSVFRKSSSAMNHNHPNVKFTVQKVQSCVGVKNQFHKVQLLKSFLMLFSVLYKLLEYTFVFSRDLVTNHYLVVAEFGFCTNYVVRSPGTNLGSARNWAWSISAEDVWRTPQQEIV